MKSGNNLTGYKDKNEYISGKGIKSVVYLMDCMEGMKQFKDNEVGLACVDPPYGMDKSSTNGSGKLKNRALNRMNTDWDIAPKQQYFKELFRVSKNQIIWGGELFFFTTDKMRIVLG